MIAMQWLEVTAQDNDIDLEVDKPTRTPLVFKYD